MRFRGVYIVKLLLFFASMSLSAQVKNEKKFGASNSSVNGFTCAADDFESNSPGAYATASAIPGWTISHQLKTSCAPNNTWLPGSAEFSVWATPIFNYSLIGSIAPSPLGGTRVLQLNNLIANSYSTKISRKFIVTPNNQVFRFAYLGIWQNANHACCEQAHFKVELRDSLNTLIQCYSYSVTAGQNACYTSTNAPYETIYGFSYKNWEVEEIDLNFLGFGNRCTINIISSDCIYGTHFGTTFFDAYCGEIISKNFIPPAFNPVSYCSSSPSMTIQGPLGYSNYLWIAQVGATTIPISQSSMNVLSILTPSIGSVYHLMSWNSNSLCPSNNSYTFTGAPSTITASVLTKPSCPEGSSGSGTVFATGSSSGYNYLWYNASNSLVATSSVALNLAPGIYSVVVNSINQPSCDSVTIAATIGAASLSPSHILVGYCNNELLLCAPDGIAHKWYYGFTPIPLPSAKCYTVITMLNMAQLSVTYTNTSGCRDSIKFTTTAVIPGNLSVITSSTCPKTNSGTATITLNPAIGPSKGFNNISIFSLGTTQTYSASIGPTLSNTVGISNLVAGSAYSVTGFDGYCRYGTNFTVPLLVPAVPFSLSPNNTTLCAGENLNAQVVFSGTILPSNYTYSWSPSNFVTGSNIQQSILITPANSTGTNATYIYTATVVSSLDNCPFSKTISIAVAPSPTLTLTGEKQICEGESTQIFVAGAINYTWSNGSQNPSAIFSPTVSTIYTVTGMSQQSCSSTETIVITVNIHPVLGISNPATICAGDMIILTAVGADKYLWNTQDTTNYILTSPNSDFTYSVVGTKEGCESIISAKIVVEKCTGILSDDNGIRKDIIFPNPSSGKFDLHLTVASKYKILNAFGQVIHSSEVLNEFHKVDLSAFPEDVYLLLLFDKTGGRVQKLVVNK